MKLGDIRGAFLQRLHKGLNLPLCGYWGVGEGDQDLTGQLGLSIGDL